MSNSRVESIDFLRGLAIVGVVSVHTIQMEMFRPLSSNSSFIFFKKICSSGHIGVEIFFLISGWLLASIYQLDRNRDLNKYFLRRFARIYPLWILFFAINLCAVLITKNSNFNELFQSLGSGSIGFNLAFLKILAMGFTFTLYLSPYAWNLIIPGGWSIQAEVAHYVLFPLFHKIGFKLVLIFSSLVNIFFVRIHNNLDNEGSQRDSFSSFIFAINRLGVLATFSFFVLGISLFLIKSKHEILYRSSGSLNFFTHFLLIAYFTTSLSLELPFGNMIQSLLVVILIYLITIRNYIPKFVRGIIARFSKYSYFIYYFHFWVLGFIGQVTSQNLSFSKNSTSAAVFFYFAILTITLVSSNLIGRFSWKYLENPIINISKRPK